MSQTWRRAAPAVAVALLAACTSQQPASSSAPSPLVGASSSAHGSSGRVLAAISEGRKAVDVYRVGGDRVANRVWSVQAPHAGLLPVQISLDAGQRPDLCVLWLKDDEEQRGSEVWCYAFGSTTGALLPVVGDPDFVALAPDGSAVLWVTEQNVGTHRYSETLVTATYPQQQASAQRTFVVARDATSTRWGCGFFLGSALWLDAGRLILECGGDNDAPGGVVVEDISPGPGAARRPGTRLGDPSLERPGAVVDDRVYALDRSPCHSGEGCLSGTPDTAVAVLLSDGSKSRVATAFAGRSIASISGGPAALVYVTSASGPATDRALRVYLKRPQDAVGRRVSGLPSDLASAVLQP